MDPYLEIEDGTIEAACRNRKQGLPIIHTLLSYPSDYEVREEALVAAAYNRSCALTLLEHLFRRLSKTAIASSAIEAAATNFYSGTIQKHQSLGKVF
jgi:hypothetical protein